jgi:N-methylhydantoinase A
VRRFALPRHQPGARRSTPARSAGRRPVFFSGEGWVDCACHARESLGAGAILAGPAVVEQLDATTVVLPGQRATVDAYGNLVIRLGAPAVNRRRPSAARRQHPSIPARSGGSRARG